MMVTRSRASRMPVISTERAKRSSSWGAQVALLRVHRPHQMKRAGWVKEMPFALDDVHAHSGRIEQHITTWSFQQVDFIYYRADRG